MAAIPGTSGRLCWMLLATIVVSCDPFHEDEISRAKVVTVNPTQTEYYIPEYGPTASVVINLKTLVSTTFETVSIRVTEYPKYGRISYLSDFFLKYTASETFREDVYHDDERRDQFGISFFQDGKAIRKQTISVRMGDIPCSLYAIEDRIKISPNVSDSWTVTSNDHLCDIRADNVEASIALEPKHGQAEMDGFTVTYTPEPDYVGSDEFVYELIASGQENLASTSPLISYGLVTVNISE